MDHDVMIILKKDKVETKLKIIAVVDLLILIFPAVFWSGIYSIFGIPFLSVNFIVTLLISLILSLYLCVPLPKNGKRRNILIIKDLLKTWKKAQVIYVSDKYMGSHTRGRDSLGS